MPHLTMLDLASRKMPKKWNPGGHKGKLHRELGISEDEKIPASRLESAEHSSNPVIRRDAIRAKTMKGWHKGKRDRSEQLKQVYDHGG